MNKLLASIALLGLGAAGTIGTLNEAATPAPEMPKAGVRKKLSMGVTQLSYKYFAIADGTTIDDLDYYPTKGRILASSDFSSDARSGTHSLKMKNQTLATRFGVLPKGGNYTLSFWAKQLSVQAENRFLIRFDNWDSNGAAAYYAYGNINLKVGEWTQFTYKFTGTNGDRTGFSMAAFGDYLIDDITLTDANKVNYILDGDFEPIEALGWECVDAGFAKQEDGSVLMGFCSNALDPSVTEARVQIAPKMTGDGKNVTVSCEFIGGVLRAVNRNGFEIGTKGTTPEAGWGTYTNTFSNDVIANGAIYFGLNGWDAAAEKSVTYIRNISAKDAEGNEYIPYNLNKEGYAEALADTLLETVVCDGGVTAPNKKIWGEMSYCYESIPNASQDYIKSFTPSETGSKVEQALYKYSYIVSKYGKNTYNDFLGYLDSGKATAQRALFEKEGTKPAFYLGIAFMATAITAGAFVLVSKKKKSAR